MNSVRASEIVPWKADRERPSPNYGKRRDPEVNAIILHATAGTDAGAESWMVNPEAQVSAHLHIRRDGSVTRHVDDEHRAWHAGRSEWKGETDLNSVSLGWEIGNANDGREPYTDAQYETVARLLRHYLPQGIDRDRVLSHAQIAPGRKTDPRGWDWQKMWALVDRAGYDPPIGRRVYSPSLGWLIVTDHRSDTDWRFVKLSDVSALPSTQAGTPLSRMPRSP